MNERARWAAALYFAAQGLSGVAWWAVLLAFPSARELFWPRSPDGTFDGRGLLAFALPDAIGFVALSFVCAFGLARRSAWVWPALWVHVGALGYATLFCINLALSTRGETFVPALLMSPALAAVAFWMGKLRAASTCVPPRE
jgi:hypothetical protein